MRIAMWSGPRNLSTAMMYSFGARSDFDVMDEPFYAAYLARTGAEHPMRDEILAGQTSNPVEVAEACRRPGAPHLYMKHMAHHMLDGFPMDWAEDCVHIHLIRHPARVIASYAAKRENPTLDDIGFVQQAALFDRVGGLVIDSADIRIDPERMLERLCAAIDLPFEAAMLRWPAGPRAEEGVWAAHWYGAIHCTTGFAGPEDDLPDLPASLKALCAAALPYYEHMQKNRFD